MPYGHAKQNGLNDRQEKNEDEHTIESEHTHKKKKKKRQNESWEFKWQVIKIAKRERERKKNYYPMLRKVWIKFLRISAASLCGAGGI